MSSELVVDACAALNLLATGRAVDILRASETNLVIIGRVASEVRYLAGPPDPGGNKTRIPVSIAPLEQASVLRVVKETAIAPEQLILAAGNLTDVDALSVAYSRQERLGLLSDDGKVRRVFAEMSPRLELRSTLQVVRHGVEELRLPESEVRQIVKELRRAGNFEPPRSDPERDWYRGLLGGA